MKIRTLVTVLFCLLFISLTAIFSIALSGLSDARFVSSWVPKLEMGQLKFSDSTQNFVSLHGSGFTVQANRKGQLSVVTNDGTIIIRSINYYNSPDLISDNYGLTNVILSLISDTILVINGNGLNDSRVLISCTAPSGKPRLDVKVKTVYTRDTKVAREALILLPGLPVTQVFKKNRTMDEGIFLPEYWLNRQGVRFGDGENEALIYQTPGVSSLQLDYEKNMLLINLEYCKDHPYIYFPYQADNGGEWMDQSVSFYPAGSERKDSVSIWFGDLPASVPRLMMLPDGYLAGYVFTEHADGSNIATHRAVYFGSDSIACADNATGGFYGNRIPTTKSVFYTDTENHPDCIAIIDKPEDGRFLNFLQQLQSTGLYDICLHTPEGMSSDRATIEEACQFMGANFATTTWIDHGMMGGKDNRECFHADAFKEDSEFYCADILKQYGVKYFWNTSFELQDSFTSFIRDKIVHFRFHEASLNFWRHYLTSTEIRETNFFLASIIALKKLSLRENRYLLDHGRDEAFPVPLYWVNPTLTDSFYSWGTHYKSHYKQLWTDGAEIAVKEEEDHIEDMIKNQIIFINHGYYVRGIPEVDLTSEKDGRVTLNPYFEHILKYMAKRRDGGDLMITTIRDLLNYQLQIEKIVFKYGKDGVEVTNNNNNTVRGLSIGVRHSDVLVNGNIPKSRISDEDRIFWFDILANETVNIKLIPKPGN